MATGIRITRVSSNAHDDRVRIEIRDGDIADRVIVEMSPHTFGMVLTGMSSHGEDVTVERGGNFRHPGGDR